MPTRPKIFKWGQTEPALILCAVRWYLRYSLSLRDVEELLEERGLEADHTTVWRWAQRYGPELEQRLRRHLKPINKSWRVDETYLRVKGRWCYLYRAIDSAGSTIDFLLSAFTRCQCRQTAVPQCVERPVSSSTRVINTDLAPIYGSAIADLKKERALRSRCHHRPVQYGDVLSMLWWKHERMLIAIDEYEERQAARAASHRAVREMKETGELSQRVRV
jgi:IS6 family transposase